MASAGHLGRVEFEVHQLVHVLQHEHVAVQLHDAIVLHEGERRQFAPAVVEARIIAVVLLHGRLQVGDVPLGDATAVESGVAFCGKGVRVQSDQRVLGLDTSQSVLEQEQAGEIVGVCDQRRPDLFGGRVWDGARDRTGGSHRMKHYQKLLDTPEADLEGGVVLQFSSSRIWRIDEMNDRKRGSAHQGNRP